MRTPAFVRVRIDLLNSNINPLAHLRSAAKQYL